MKKKKIDFDGICKTIALKNGISVESVKQNMQSAINIAFENPTEEQKLFQQNIPRKGEIPTAEEVLDFIYQNLK